MRVIVSTIALGMALLTGSTATTSDAASTDRVTNGSVSTDQGTQTALPVIHVPCIGCW